MPAINSEKPLHKNIVSYIKINLATYNNYFSSLLLDGMEMSRNKYVLMASLPEKDFLYPLTSCNTHSQVTFASRYG